MRKGIGIFLIFLIPIFMIGCSQGENGHDGHEDREDHSSQAGHNHDINHEHGAHEHGNHELDDNHGFGQGEGHDHEGQLIIEEEKAKSYGIKTAILAPGNFSEVIKVSGIVEPAPSEIMTVTARRNGIFRLAPGIVKGTHVEKGSLIGTISAKGLQGGDAGKAAGAVAEAAKRELDRLTPLYEEGLVTASQYNSAKRDYEEALAYSGGSNGGASSETAPCSGTVTELLVSSGQFVETGDPVAVISGNTVLTLRADVPQRYLSFVPAIKTANFRPDYSREIFSLDSLQGKMTSGIRSTVSDSGYLPVYFSFSGNGKVIPGSFAEVYLIGAPRTGVISVGKEALLEIQGNKYVYVVIDGHAYEKRPVVTGATDGKRVELTEGVNPGETVVVKGASIVRMAETSAIAPPSHNHEH